MKPPNIVNREPLRSAIALATLLSFAFATATGCNNDQAVPSLIRGGIDDPATSICTEPNAPAACGVACERDSDCGAGAFCLNEMCDAFCRASGDDCGVGETCSARGRCERNMADGGTPIGCDETIEVPTNREIPNVMVIVDRSGSMEADFEGDCRFVTPPRTPCATSGVPNPEFGDERWGAARDALVGPDGLVRRLGSVVQFGFAAYDKPPGAMCPPAIESVPMSLDNAGAIASLYSTLELRGGWTPTAEALDAVTDSLTSQGPVAEPTAFVLATDGFPNGCNEVTDEQIDLDRTVAAAARAHSLGIDTYVLGVSFEDSHLQDVANAGLGVPNGASWWTAFDVDQLESALLEIVGQQIPCTVTLEERIRVAEACQGNVRLNGESLECGNEENGWRAVDETTVELLGLACTRWRAGLATELVTTFPCGLVVQ